MNICTIEYCSEIKMEGINPKRILLSESLKNVLFLPNYMTF